MSGSLATRLEAYATQGLLQIERTAGKSIWDAHWGCAVIAGALLMAEDLVEAEATPEIEALLKSISTGQHGFHDQAASLRQPMEITQFTKQLLDELAIRADEAREIGHGVIYSAYVLKALNYFEITPWKSLLVALTGLIRDINASGPGWITVNGTNESRILQAAEEKTSADYWTTFAKFDRSLPMEIGDLQLGHLLTHGHAIQMIAAHADADLIAAFDFAYRRRLHVLRLANPSQRDRTPLPLRKVDPRALNYWAAAEQLGDMHGHILKYAYSFLALRGRNISSADLEAYGRIVWPDKAFPATHSLKSLSQGLH